MTEPIKPKNTPITGAQLGEAPPPDSNEVFGNPRSFPFLWKRNQKPIPGEADVRPPTTRFPGQIKPQTEPEG